MSYPNIPDVSPFIDLSRDQVINLLLASIAFEELGLAHIINSEAEKIQYVLGTLDGHKPSKLPTIQELHEINRSVERRLRTVIKNQMLLQFKLEDILCFPEVTSSCSTTSSSTSTTITTTKTTTSCTSTNTTTTHHHHCDGNSLELE
jgi:hypothetical protein